MAKSKKVVTKPKTVYLAELLRGGDHRIVRVDANGCTAGDWAHYQELAKLGNHRHATNFWEGLLPVGIFTCHATDCDVVGDPPRN